jgi:hypothetical protein
VRLLPSADQGEPGEPSCIGEGEEIGADLVVDATGRHARTIDWFATLGYPAPVTTVVKVDTRYVSRMFRKSTHRHGGIRSNTAPPFRLRTWALPQLRACSPTTWRPGHSSAPCPA